MALEVLQNQGWGPYVSMDLEKNEITFKVQREPIGEVGENGCQIDMLIYVARNLVAGLNRKFPCRENSVAITKLDEAQHWLTARGDERTFRGVEGFNKE